MPLDKLGVVRQAHDDTVRRAARAMSDRLERISLVTLSLSKGENATMLGEVMLRQAQHDKVL